MHPNEELLRRGYDARARGDLDEVAATYHDDIRWHVPGRNKLAGIYRGKDGAREYMRARQELANGSFEITIHDVLANDRHGFVVASGSATRDGRAWSWRGHVLYRFAAGKIAEVWLLPEDQDLFDEIWS